jgi:hypothetical protein
MRLPPAVNLTATIAVMGALWLVRREFADQAADIVECSTKDECDQSLTFLHLGK